MVYRHSLITRITHATFFLSFFGLAASGVQIYFHLKWLHLPVVTLHEYLGLAMLASGVVYICSGILSGKFGKLLFGANDTAGVLPMTAYYLRLRKDPPQCGEYNPLQKLAYTLVLLFIGPLIVVSGLAMWKHSPLQPPLAAIFSSHSAKIWHIGFAIELMLFFASHMMMVAATGLRNNLRSILTGWSAAVYNHGGEH
jgi:thiosulfate reductase cytochrome b subunit